jgi:two-component sensor histidine kinase
MLFTHWERRYPYLAEATPLAEEGLLVPFQVEGKSVGTIWAIAHDDLRRFDAEDLRQLQSFGRFASAAYKTVQLQHAEVLIDELNHRVKNTLATVQSIAAHTLTSATDLATRQNFEARLIALSRTHDLLSRGVWESAGLRNLLLQELEPFQSANGSPYVLEGPGVELRPKAALALGMAFHELATNAAKYGALSTPQGRVQVTWQALNTAEGRVLRLCWTETGGPPVENTGHRGFGTILIESGLSLELDGKVVLALEPGGLRCTIEIPIPAE